MLLYLLYVIFIRMMTSSHEHPYAFATHNAAYEYNILILRETFFFSIDLL